MPNWCRQKIEITGEGKLGAAMRMYNAKGEVDFNEILPIPPELDKGNISFKEMNTNQELIDKYGSDNWYDWCLENWGVKWNARNTEKGDKTWKVSFETPWGVADRYFKYLSRMFPKVTIRIDWADEFQGNGNGTVIFKNGEAIEDLDCTDNEDHWNWVWGWD